MTMHKRWWEDRAPWRCRPRVDQWLWAVRLYKTRSTATEACRAGHAGASTAQLPRPPPRYGSGTGWKLTWRAQIAVLEIVRVIDKRVGASQAAECLIDRQSSGSSRQGMKRSYPRERGAGRPTKRDRRRARPTA